MRQEDMVFSGGGTLAMGDGGEKDGMCKACCRARRVWGSSATWLPRWRARWSSYLEAAPMVILLVLFCAIPATSQQNDNFRLQPPPDIRALGPPPKPPWVKYELECSETEASGIRRVLGQSSTPGAGQLTGGGIAGIVLVIIILVLVAIAAMLYVWYRRKHRISPATAPETCEKEENYLYNYKVQGRKWPGQTCEEKGQLYQKEPSCLGSASSIDGGYNGGEISQSSTHTEELVLHREKKADHGGSTSSGVELSLSDLRDATSLSRAQGIYSRTKSEESKFDDLIEDPQNPSSDEVSRSQRRTTNRGRTSLPILAPICSSTQPTYSHTVEDESLPDILQSVPSNKDNSVSSSQSAVHPRGPFAPVPPKRTKPRRKPRKRSIQSEETSPPGVALPSTYQPKLSPNLQHCQTSGML